MAKHPGQFSKSTLQRAQAFTKENMEEPRKDCAPLKERSRGQFVLFEMETFSPRIWDGDSDGGTKPTWFSSQHLPIPTRTLDALLSALPAISENQPAGVDVGEHQDGEEAAGNEGVRGRDCHSQGSRAARCRTSSTRSWGGTVLRRQTPPAPRPRTWTPRTEQRTCETASFISFCFLQFSSPW